MLINHKGTIVLETKHLILRPFALTDGKEMYENWASDPDVTQFLRWEPHENHTLTNELLEIWHNQYSRPDFYQWAIYHKKHDTLIGSISAFKRDDNAFSETEIGYCLGKAFWGMDTAQKVYVLCATIY